MDEKHLEMAERLTSDAVTSALAKVRTTQNKPEDFDGTCTCGEEIPPARIGLGYYNCIDCQTAKEARAGRR